MSTQQAEAELAVFRLFAASIDLPIATVVSSRESHQSRTSGARLATFRRVLS
jgi:hypothetical protein